MEAKCALCKRSVKSDDVGLVYEDLDTGHSYFVCARCIQDSALMVKAERSGAIPMTEIGDA